MQLMREILQAGGHDVTLICRDWQAGAAGVIACDPPRRGRIQREAGFARAALKIAQQQAFQVVQSHERIPGCTVYRAGDGVHRSWLEQRSRQLSPWGRWWLKQSRYHRYVLQAEREMFEHPQLRAVICNSKLVQQEILTHFAITPEKLHLIYNGVNTNRFHPRLKQHRTEIRAQWGLTETTPLFLFVGSGWERKGLGMTLRALGQVPEAHLLVVGRDKAERQFQRQINRSSLTGRVHFAGVLSDPAPAYGAADVLILPALYDPFPNAILEAMAAGLPVITSETCGGVDLIQTGVNGGVCDALDASGLTRLCQSFSDQKFAAAQGTAARETVEPLTPERMRQQLMALYAELLN